MTEKTVIPSLRAAVLCSALLAHVVLANPVVCSPGYWDATCNPRIAAGYQAPPTCSQDPGWTTGSAAQWQGSHFSSPQCNYQAPPSCPAGYSTISGPSWNGSSWVGLACAIPPPPSQGTCQYGFLSGPTWTGSSWSYTCNAPPPPPPPVGDRSAICSDAITAGMAALRPVRFGTFSALDAQGYVPPEKGGGYQMSMYGGDTHYSGATDGIWAYDANNPGGAGGPTGSGGIGSCIFRAGTSNLLMWEYDIVVSYDGG
ncbi:hypothetical protein OKW35_000150 [Paraburkholderia sp. MM5477-R1]|uniref:Major paralogous domain-containing protein n=1 Tax=Paraburkholderia tuberum TaxID=157910 RepID=A0A1H1KL73_9BURK|nr:hypothetical protein SAMN05445850_8432 [Paraburkholderia tuberum]